jgi:hypothetical protein
MDNEAEEERVTGKSNCKGWSGASTTHPVVTGSGRAASTN